MYLRKYEHGAPYGAPYDKICQPGHLEKRYLDKMSVMSESYVYNVIDVVKTSLNPKHNER
jgi:hypothetical protein